MRVFFLITTGGEYDSGKKGWKQDSFLSSSDEQAQQCEEEDVFPFQAFEVDRAPQRKILAALVYKDKAKNASQGFTPMRIFSESMSLPVAKTWLHCRPCKPLLTLINAPQFTPWMKYYCQVSLFQIGTKYNRPQCAAIMDM